MKKVVKKPSTKIVVDEFDKYYRRDNEDRLKKTTNHQKQSNYHRFIQQELPQKQTKFQQKFHYQPYKKEELRDSIYKKPNQDIKQKIQEKMYDFMSDDSEDIYNITAQSKRESNQKTKKQIDRQKLGIKKSENIYFNQSKRDQDYYPVKGEEMQRKEVGKMQKDKRPSSAMNKKYQGTQKIEKSKKQDYSIIKKTLSSSKFKEQHKMHHTSQHKQTKTRNKETLEHLKINSIPQKQLTNQYRELVGNNLKKKAAISKPLKIEQLHKVYSHHDSSKKMNSSQLVQKMRYPKQEEKVQIKPKKSVKLQKQQEEKPIFFKNRLMKERQHSQNSRMQESQIRPHHYRFQQQSSQRADQQQRERVYSRRRRPPAIENQSIRRQQAPIQTRNQRQQRRQREQSRPQQNRNQNLRRQNQNQPRQPRRQGEPRRQQQQNRNTRNPRYQSSTSRQQQNPNNIFRLVSQTINGQLEFINNQFNMMSNIFENISNFVNINIDAHPNYYFGEYGQYSHSNMSSSGFDSDTSESFSSDYDYYQNEQEPQGMDQQQLNQINKLKYKVSEHGNNQCTICLIQLKNGDQAKKLFCDHLFHSQCIDEWLRRKSACPVCRDKQ